MTANGGQLFLTLVSLVLSAGVAALPLRWAILSYMVLVHFDFTGPYGASSEVLGLQNTVKIVLLPVLLLARCGPRAWTAGSWRTIAWAWISLTVYAAIGILWSPYPLSGAKMVAYLISTAVIFLVFRFAWSQPWFSLNLVRWGLAIGLLLGVVQTQFFGNPFGTMDELYFSSRFTSFTSPQSFAVFLLAMLSVEYVLQPSGKLRSFFIAVTTIALLFSGSRYSFVGLICLLLIAISGRTFLKRRGTFRLVHLIPKSAAVLTAMLLLAAAFINFAPNSRLSELLEVNLNSSLSFEDVGSFAWRWNVYQESYSELASRNLPVLLRGSGTSSGGDYQSTHAAEFFGIEDPNRVFHNEFLRAIYEWGIAGFGLLVFLIGAIGVHCWKSFRDHHLAGLVAIALLPTMLFSLLVENILSNAGSPAMTGFVLVLALVCAVESHNESTLTKPASVFHRGRSGFADMQA